MCCHAGVGGAAAPPPAGSGLSVPAVTARTKQKPIYAPQAPRVFASPPRAAPKPKGAKPARGEEHAPQPGGEQRANGTAAEPAAEPAEAPVAPPEGDTADGVPRYGCPKCRYLAAGCAKCLKGPTVRSRWQPEKGHRMDHIPPVPTYYPTDEEWEDPFAYVARIRPEGEQFGICKVVAPPGWKPPFSLPQKDALRFPTRIQAVHELQNRQPGGPVVVIKKRGNGKAAARKAAEEAAAAAAAGSGAGEEPMQQHDVDDVAPHLWPPTRPAGDGDAAGASAADVALKPAAAVVAPASRMGGMPVGRMGGGGAGPRKAAFVAKAAIAQAVAAETAVEPVDEAPQPVVPAGADGGDSAAAASAPEGASAGSAPPEAAAPVEPEEPQPYGFRPGEKHGMASLERFSRFFTAKYFCSKTGKPKTDLQLGDIEAEFWRLVEDSSSAGGATGVAEVVYGADIQTGEVGSGFPSVDTSHGDPGLLRYARAPANVCNMPFQQGSCLRHVEKTTGISVPWLYFGMTLSAFCWHVEDHHFYSVNYHHLGDPKVWYSVPASHSAQLEALLQTKLPHLFASQPGLLHALVTLISPEALRQAGIPVYRAVQEAGCYIITFPYAYHAGFNAGFNCAEATNFAPADWLPFGLDASERYSQDARYCSVAHDKMLMELGRAASQPDAALHPSLPPTIAAELDRRTLLEVERRSDASHSVGSEQRMSPADLALCADTDCAVCLADLHISAIYCACSPDQPTCLRHVGCCCAPSDRVLKYQYSMQEMQALAHAVRDVASPEYEVMRPLADRFDEKGQRRQRKALATRAQADTALKQAMAAAAKKR